VQRLELGQHQQAGISRKMLCNTDDRGVFAVGGGERVIDVHVTESRELASKVRVVVLVAGVKSDVLEEHQVAFAQASNGGLGGLAHAVFGKRDWSLQQLGKPPSDRPERELRHSAALRTVEVGHDDDPSSPMR